MNGFMQVNTTENCTHYSVIFDVAFMFHLVLWFVRNCYEVTWINSDVCENDSTLLQGTL